MFGAATLALALTPSLAMARTWHIAANGPSDAPSVQAGIDSAVVGDTVLVGPGTFFESIDFLGKDVAVLSISGPQETILDATGLDSRVVTFASHEGRQAILSGFSVTGGKGGIIVVDAEPTIVGNIITNNSGSEDGGGIWCGGSTSTPFGWAPLIENNVIANNLANGLAGGIGVHQVFSPEIINNRIENNRVTRGDGRGIFYLSLYDGALIKGNFVIGNTAGDHGGGIYVAQLGDGVVELEIAWNLVANNQANGQAMTGDSGGGIWLWETDAWVHHNTIVGNIGNGINNNYGGAVVLEQPGSPIVEQNVIAFSQAGGGILCAGGVTPTIRNNLAWQNLGGDGLGSCSTWLQGNGNVRDNPYFCDMAAGDFRVAANSGVITHPAGPLGAFPIPGCGPVSILPSTWGMLKAKYGDH
jgi:predicted outer membrane repeat protein